MAVTTVNNTGLDVNAVMNTAAVSNTKKTVETKTQDFSSVLNSTTQNSKSQQDNTPTVDKTAKTVSKTDDKVSDAQTPKDNTDTVKADEPVSDNTQETVSENPENTVVEEVDDTIIEEIATALTFILDNVKELLNVDDETIAVTMEDMGLTNLDLLNSDNLTEFVAAISGEDSVISLVADEDLYSKLNALTDIVDTQFETVLDNTGLSEDELNTVIENLISQEDNNVEVADNQADLAQTVIGDEEKTVDADNQAVEEEPVYIVQDNTTKPATTYSKLPENQQDTTNLKNDAETSNTSQRTDKNSDKQSKDYSENQSYSQSHETTVEENISEVTETTTSYTSGNTESIMRQLADVVKVIKNDNLTQMELQLHPASLGTVNVSLVTKGGAVTAQFTTQSEQVKTAIEAQAAQLQADLENQGVKVEAIEVAVESHQMERNLDDQNRRQEKEGQQAEDSLKTLRRQNINLRTLGEDGSLLEEIQGADDATRIAMELMSANGNTMDMMV